MDALELIAKALLISLYVGSVAYMLIAIIQYHRKWGWWD